MLYDTALTVPHFLPERTVRRSVEQTIEPCDRSPSHSTPMPEKIDIEAAKSEDHNKLAMRALKQRPKKLHLGGEKRATFLNCPWSTVGSCFGAGHFHII